MERLKHQLHGTTPIQSHGTQGATASAQMTQSLHTNQAIQASAVYGNPAVNQTQATPYGQQQAPPNQNGVVPQYANQAVTQNGLAPPTFNNGGGQPVNHIPMYANQPANQIMPGQTAAYAHQQQPFNPAAPMVMPMYADQAAYAQQPNGAYNDMYADQDYYDEYDDDEYDDYHDGYDSNPEENYEQRGGGRRHRSNSLGDGSRGRRGYSRDGRGYDRSPSRDRHRSGDRSYGDDGGDRGYNGRRRGYGSEGDPYAESAADYGASPSRLSRAGYRRYPNRGGDTTDARSADPAYDRASRYDSPNRFGGGGADTRSRLSRSDYGAARDRYSSPSRRDPSQGHRSASRGRSGYYSDPDSPPSRSPEGRRGGPSGEMRRYFVPRRGQGGGGSGGRPGQASRSRSRGAASPARRMPSPIRPLPVDAAMAPVAHAYPGQQQQMAPPGYGGVQPGVVNSANMNPIPNMVQPSMNQPNMGASQAGMAAPSLNGLPMANGSIPMGATGVPLNGTGVSMVNGYAQGGGVPGLNVPNIGMTAPNGYTMDMNNGYPQQGHAIDSNMHAVSQPANHIQNTAQQPLYSSQPGYHSNGSMSSVSMAPVPNGYHPAAGTNGYQPGVVNGSYQPMNASGTYGSGSLTNGNNGNGVVNGFQATGQGSGYPVVAGQQVHGEYHIISQGGNAASNGNSYVFL